MILPRETEVKFERVLTLLLNHGYDETADAVRDIRDEFIASVELHRQTQRLLAESTGPGVTSVIEQHGLCVAFSPKERRWRAQDCYFNELVGGDTLDEAVQKLLPKLIRCQRCQSTTTRTVHEYYCKRPDCEVRESSGATGE